LFFLLFSIAVPKLGTSPAAYAAGDSVFEHFVTRQGDKLMEGTEEFRFISTNMPDVLQIITNKQFESDSRIRLPNEYELRDAVATVKQMNGRVMRTFVVTVTNGDDPNYMVRVSENEIAFNEEAMLVLDKLLQICNEMGVRIYIPLVNYNDGIRGGTTTYGENFFTVGSSANQKFKQMVEQLLNRTNRYTGIPYKEDKAILGWESGNEIVINDLPERSEWLHDLAGFVKQIAPNQPFIDGRNKPDDVYKFSGGNMVQNYNEFLDDENIDILSYHTYVGLTGPVTDSSLPAGLRNNTSGDIGATSTLKIIRELTKGKKPLVVGEIAMYMAPSTLVTFLDELIANGTSGANWWATRFHNRDGGFYKHSDNGSQHEDLNWPGFPGTVGYVPEIEAEISIQNTLREKAWKIMGHTDAPPALPVPAAPGLLPIPDVGHISWQGSTGAQSYEVERSESAAGPWTVVGVVYDNLPTYSSLFHDRDAQPGHTYYYRVIAKNSSGASEPSNVSPPVTVDRQWIVDELFDFSKTYAREPNATIFKSYANTSNQEDLGVLKSINGTSTSVEYAMPGKLRKAAVYVYDAPGSVSLYGSLDGKTYFELETQTVTFENSARTKYTYEGDAGYRFLKLELNGSAVVGRAELEYDPDQIPAPEPKPASPYRNPNLILEAELFNYNENDFSKSDVVTNNRGVVKVNQTGGSNSAASNKRFSIVDFLQTGDYAVFYANIEAGTYDLKLDYDARSARGMFQMSILEPGVGDDAPGIAVGGVIDAYDPGNGIIKSVDYGKITFPQSGRYGFKFVSMGKNSASSNPKIGLDVIKLLSDNVAPTVTGATYSTDDATPIHGVLKANDLNGDPLTYIVIHHPAKGQLTVNDDGTFVYAPEKGATGQFAFKWKANDGWINSNTAQVILQVTASDDSNNDSGGAGSGSGSGSGNGTGSSSGVGGGVASGSGNSGASDPVKETVATIDGRTVVSVTFEPEAFERLLDQSGQHGNVTIDVSSAGDMVKLEMNGAFFKKMYDRQNDLVIKSDAGSYRLPVHQADLDAILKLFGGTVEWSGVDVQLAISRSTAEQSQAAAREAERNGFSLAATPVSFDLMIVVGNQTIPVDRFLSYVERTIPLLPGNRDGQTVTGVLIRPDGTFLHVPTRLTEENGKTSAVLSSMTNSTYAVVAGKRSFQDTFGHWGAADINELASRMIANGMPDNRFEPDRPVTRAEFAALLNRALGLGNKAEKSQFYDVQDQEWFAGEIGTAKLYGLISGYEDGTFRPLEAITREEAMHTLAAAAKLAGLNTAVADQEIAEKLHPFQDAELVESWAKRTVAAMLKLGIVEGRAGVLDPKQPITRAETAAILIRLLRTAELI
jgi:hypothetical protein